jgi:hypothetical protein
VALALGLALATVLAACSSSPTGVKVATYVRNATSHDVSVVVKPEPAPPISILVVAGGLSGQCTPIVAGSQIVLTGGPPSSTAPDGEQLVAIVGAQDPGTERVVWVDIAADETITSGTGTPAWWSAGEVSCS